MSPSAKPPSYFSLRKLVMPLVLAAGATCPAQAGESHALPGPLRDMPATASDTLQTAVLAGGCFWGVQAVFQHVAGVTAAVSGYAGGATANPTYEEVSTGLTGHAESVKVTFDPHTITYGELLRIYFSVAHDPTQFDAQPDRGTQYRSAIFTTSEAQKGVAESYIQQLKDSHLFPAPIVTSIEPLGTFTAAESYHQDYLEHHPNNPYIVVNDLPKLRDLQRLFPEHYVKDSVSNPM